jgi:hypothetical protein
MQGAYDTKSAPQWDARRDDPAAHLVAELAHVGIVPALLEHPAHDIRRGVSLLAHGWGLATTDLNGAVSLVDIRRFE